MVPFNAQLGGCLTPNSAEQQVKNVLLTWGVVSRPLGYRPPMLCGRAVNRQLGTARPSFVGNPMTWHDGGKPSTW